MASSPPRHKRRKASCKEFQCTHEGCGRTYSRAEHLQRHQLNHSPKEIYYCDYPGCSFSFVRKDLYARHKLRHERQIQQYGNGRLSQRPSSSQREFTKVPRRPRYSFSEDGSAWSDTQDEARETPAKEGNSKTNNEAGGGDLPGETAEGSGQLASNQDNDMNDTLAHFGNQGQLQSRESSISPEKPQLGNVPFRMDAIQNADMSMAMASPGIAPRPERTRNQSFVLQGGLPTTNGDTLLDDQPFGVSPSSTDEFTSWLFNGQGINAGYALAPGSALGGMGGYSNNFGQLCPEYTTQPGMMGSNFMEPMNLWFQSETIPMATPVVDLSQLGKAGMSEHKRQSLIQYMMQRFNEIGSQGTRSATDMKNEIFGIDSDSDTHVLSLANVQRYMSSYWENFHDQLPILHRPTFVPETAHDFLLLAVLIMGASMLEKRTGPSDMTDKISKFTTFVSWNLRWQVFMHADSHPPAKLWVIQTLLILEVYEKLNATRVLHERAHIYFPTTLSLMRRGSALTGKQSSYASRVPSPLMSPRLGGGPKLPPASSGRREFDPSSPEKWWDHWIAQEATRRAAFAAFIIDATHAALFGHTPTLVIHEIKLPLPCDNTLWSSDSPSEIGCVESSLYANGVTPVTFLDGLQRTLNGQKVRTSPFGRIALLAALLSVTWQMHQRDLDRSTLGTDTIPGVQERWRPKLLRAFDWWKKDYDDGIAHVRHAAFDWQRLGLSSRGGSDDGDAFQTLGTVLYHLGHITVYISMPELCIFAGVPQILGRTVTSLDWRRTEAKIKEWVASPGAIGGVYHALQLVKLILLQEDPHENALGESNNFNPPPYPTYDAGNDNLLNRAWALYYAALVLWAYGFVQDGSLEPFPENLQYPLDNLSLPAPRMVADPSVQSSSGASLGQGATPVNDISQQASLETNSLSLSPNFDQVKHDRHEDLKTYLQIMIPPTINSIKAFHVHQNQAGVVGNRNKIIGLLSVVDEALSSTKWELLMEARHRLRMAASMMKNPGER
ncbi:fungal-specific transcription factor domain-containing protein [Thelonectria olida]|uniref:Fungal-specific transcription factor domain-containing protein n=1 Tax=Thelonectria olida TaxID=1576542 RepID=A0A9P8VZ77_9HYPO|nr:fungal-specific transcription factor domain-containing protein [Thelonectria olida]